MRIADKNMAAVMMIYKSIRYAGTLLLSVMVMGCSNPIESCSYLALEEVKELDPSIVSSSYVQRIKNHPTMFCIWKNSAGVELLLINVGLNTKNTPYAILDTFKGEDQVRHIQGVGNSAAAMFSKKGMKDDLEIFLARNERWTLDMRSKLVGNVESKEFSVLKKLANKAFNNLD